MKSFRPLFAALIATRNRTDLLAKRSLPSVAAQTSRPDWVIVVDDSASHFRDRNKKAVRKFSAQSGIRAVYLSNRRGKGASGAWNTGALSALAEGHDKEHVYLAVLDDDDQWKPEHLAQAKTALRATNGRGFDLMAAAFERKEPKQKYVIHAPPVLNGRDFLVGNPGVGGSTMIIRLSAFFRAGMFDESLTACTDRDFCFRLSLLPGVAYKPLPLVSVIHHADDNRVRLSNAHGAAKIAGLSGFSDKYRGWMSGAEYAAFCKRAKDLFGWTGAEHQTKPPSKNFDSGDKFVSSGGKIALLVGVIVNPEEQDNPLFADILALAKDKRLSSVDVVIMPSSGCHRAALRAETAKLRRAGLRIYCIDDIQAIAPLRDFFDLGGSRKLRPIAVNRTILQHAISRIAVFYRSPVCWILDGDNRLHGLRIANKRLARFRPDYVGEMIRLRDSGCDIAVGAINGAAPLPRAFTVRTQMVDVMHVLGRLQQSAVDGRRPAATVADISGAHSVKNYHHDCLSHPHLEQPAGLLPLPKKCSLHDWVGELPTLLGRILAGDSVTRPLLSSDGGVSASYIHRGGNTLIFDLDALCGCPNGLARGHFSGMRRQDEIWRIFNESAFARKVVVGDFPVAQSRENDAPHAPDIGRMVEDIVGHAAVTAMRDIIGGGRFDGVQSLVDALLSDDSDFFGEIDRAARARLNAVQASFLRICGIAATMRQMIDKYGDEAINKAAMAALEEVESRFSSVKFGLLKKRVLHRLDIATMRSVFLGFPNLCHNYGALKKVWASWIRKERKTNAGSVLARLDVTKHPLRFLGQGGEGTVFTDGKKVFKVLHRWDSRVDVTDADFLPSLADNVGINGALYPILDSRRDGGDLILTMPFEKTAPYKGGCGPGMAVLLASLKKNGIVLRDLTPKNLRRKGNTVRLIDYGQHLQPFTEEDFDLSVRKAWLCWRWAFRADLRALLTASLTTPDMPELAGYENMKTAIEQYAACPRPADTIMEEILRGSPCRILDYGCGKGRDAMMLAASGFIVAAFDPALTAKSEAHLKTAGVRVIKNITDPSLSGGYDIVCLRHILCEIESDAALRRCLVNINGLLAPEGKVMVTACDLHKGVSESATARNIIPRDADFDCKFLYRKNVRFTGGVRRHVHRPEHILEREFARAQYGIESRRVFADMNLERFEPCGGVLQWTLAPLLPRPSVALIIRACAMDADSVGPQTRCLVGQLNYPRGFTEIIMAVDLKTEGFLREHVSGNLPALLDSAQRLKQQGWIDRIVVAPSDKMAIRCLNQKWLGLDCEYSHAANAAPLTVVFTAFERCQSRYALHIDVDMIAGRKDSQHDYLANMLDAMESRKALTMSLDIPGASAVLKENRKNPFRLEVRAGLTDLARIKKMLPLGAHGDPPPAGWHRVVDGVIRGEKISSLRGGDQRLYAFHPPNQYKHLHESLDIVVNAAGGGFFPAVQRGKNEWDGTVDGWLPTGRREMFIFVVCGRDVDAGKINRCLNSILQQKFHDWGAVLMDDASSPSSTGCLRLWAEEHPRRLTHFVRSHSVGGLANLSFAVRRLCADPESIIITLDMDDALLGISVLERLKMAYAEGADITVGSMLRTDKQGCYPVRFDNPRANRGGNVWQHLRSFKKRLFDAVPDSALRDDDGEYFQLAEDWAYMLPMIEMAKRPVWIKDALYLYEPDERRKKMRSTDLESTIARIVRRPSFLPSPQKEKK